MNKSFKYSDRRGLPGGPNEQSSYSEGFVVSERGQWDYPGMDTLVPTPTGNITMQGVPYPVYGQDETGYGQMMYPGADYVFPGNFVYETPMAQYGRELPRMQTAGPIDALSSVFSTPLKGIKDAVTPTAEALAKLYTELRSQEIEKQSRPEGAKRMEEIRITPYETLRRKYDTPAARDQWINSNLPKFARSMGINRDNWNPDEWKKYQKDINTKIAKEIFKRKPFNAGDGKRLENLKKYSNEELEIIKGSDYAKKIEPTIWQKFEQGLLSIGNVGSPVEFKNENLTEEEAKQESTPLNLLQPLNIPRMAVQAAAQKVNPTIPGGYTMSEALAGVENEAPATDLLYMDPLNYMGYGLFRQAVKPLVSGASRLYGNIGSKLPLKDFVPTYLTKPPQIVDINIPTSKGIQSASKTEKPLQYQFDFEDLPFPPPENYALFDTPHNNAILEKISTEKKLEDDLKLLSLNAKIKKLGNSEDLATAFNNVKKLKQETWTLKEGYKSIDQLFKEMQQSKAFPESIITPVQQTAPVQKSIKVPIDYTKPLITNQDYIDWANIINKDLNYHVTPEELRQAHIEAIDYFGKNPVGIEGKEYGMYIRNKFADRIPTFTDPVRYDADGNIIFFRQDSPHVSNMPWGASSSAIEKHSGSVYDFANQALIEQNYNIGLLTPEEINAMYGYAKGYDASINGVLRSQIPEKNPSLLSSLTGFIKNQPKSKTSEFYTNLGETLNQGILKNKIKNAVEVRRGIGGNYSIELLDPVTHQPTGKIVNRSDLNEGDVFMDKSFISTSQDLSPGWGQSALSEIIQLPAGSIQSYAYPNASSWSPFANETEFILPKNLIRRVDKVLDPVSTGAKYKTSILNPYQMGGPEDESNDQFPIGTMNINIQDIPDDVLAIMIANNR